MKPIGVLFNPISGRGRGAAIAVDTVEKIIETGIAAELHESKRRYAAREAEAMLERFSALLIVGGDGTLRALLPALATTRVPVHMFPAGNESLFARHFSMKRDVAKFIDLVKLKNPSEHCFGLVNGQPFFSMVSIGLDSEVIAILAEKRTGAIGHKGYLVPTLRALLSYRAPQIWLESEGRRLVDGERGYVNVANAPEYARCLNPVPEAASSREMLVAGFYPHSSATFYLRWLLPLLRRKPVCSADRRFFTEKSFTISTGEAACPVQADGEHVGRTPVEVKLAAGKILVL